MNARERLLLGITVVGAVLPTVMAGLYFARPGASGAGYFGAWIGTLPSAQLTVDLTICCVAFFVWAWWEGRRCGIRRWWVVVPATALVGLCFALPLFLLFRERAMASVESPGRAP